MDYERFESGQMQELSLIETKAMSIPALTIIWIIVSISLSSETASAIIWNSYGY